MPDFTATETRIMRVLADGQPHRKEEIHACLPDELGALNNVQMHISNIRKKLRPVGQGIHCDRVDTISWYRLVRYTSIEEVE